MFVLILTEPAFFEAGAPPVVGPASADQARGDVLARSIVEDGHYVLTFDGLEKALIAIEKGIPDVVIVGMRHVRWTSLDQIEVVHLRNPSVPLLVVGVRMTDHEEVMALDAGASECIDIACPPSVFLARLRALARRSGPNAGRPTRINMGAYDLCNTTRSATVAGHPVSLTELEFDVAWMLFSNFERTVSRDVLLRNVWRQNVERDTRRIDVMVVRLRNKLKLDVVGELRLVAVRGHGYRLLRSAKPSDEAH